MAEVIAEHVPLPDRLADVPVGDRHRHDPRVRAEEDEKVFPQRAPAQQDKGGNDDEKGAQVIRRADAPVERRSPILGIYEFFEEVLQNIHEHHCKQHDSFCALRPPSEQEICADGERDH